MRCFARPGKAVICAGRRTTLVALASGLGLTMRALSSIPLFLCALLVSSVALASPGNIEAEPLDPKIYGGAPVESCGWPTTVELDGCTGTLIHPEVIITAGHCTYYGGTPGYARFGEDRNAPARMVEIAECGGHPDWDMAGRDFAYCRLAEPVYDVPIVPPLMGCELDQLRVGSEVVVVGFGDADDNLGWGPKREVTTEVTALENGEAWIGGGGLDSCQGDSGGPAFLQLDDGSWRVFGITSGGGACGEGGYYSMMDLGMPWFEEQLGFDITPCTDAEGNWDPGPACADAPYEPATGGGSWATGCSASPLSGAIDSCGPATGGDDPAGTGGEDPEDDSGGEDSGSDEDAGGDEDSGSGETGGDGDDPSGGGHDPGGDAMTIEFACACSSAPTPAGATGLPLLGLLFALRRRRRRRRRGLRA